MNKNILLIGCNGGIGSGLVPHLIERGYSVYGLDMADSAKDERVHYYKINLRDSKSIEKAYQEISKEITELYALVVVSGIYILDSLVEIPEETMEKMIDINILGIYRSVKTFYPLLKPGSRIYLTSSEVATLDPLPFNGLYAVIKSTIEKYAFALRMELNVHDIKVSLIRPGPVKTDLLDSSMDQINKFCDNTVVYKDCSSRFKKIACGVESKHLTPDQIGEKIAKIISKKHVRYGYYTNRSKLLIILNMLPDHFQNWIICKILKGKEKREK